jgi:hypothetical protein
MAESYKHNIGPLVARGCSSTMQRRQTKAEVCVQDGQLKEDVFESVQKLNSWAFPFFPATFKLWVTVQKLFQWTEIQGREQRK